MRRAQQRGIALVMVLWVVVLLTAMATAVLTTQRNGVNLTRSALDAARGQALVEAGMNYAMLRLLAQAEGARLAVDGQFVDWAFAGYPIRIAVRPEAGLVDLNVVDAALLARLFETAGQSPGEAAALAGAVVDWRDPDDVRQPRGAEAGDYRAAGLPYGPANAPFQDVSELRLVLGVSPALFEGVRDALTVDSRQPRPLFAAAPPLVQAALQAESPRADNGSRLDTLASGFALGIANAGIAFGGAVSGGGVNALRVRVEVQLGADLVYSGEATLAPGDNRDAGVRLIRWHTMGFGPVGPI